MLTQINILDYSPIFENTNAQKALFHTRELAQLADELGYHRYWVAEPHHVFSVASSSPGLLMMQLAALTKRVRIGSGGVMLPHYSPYKVAENFRMLEAFYPNRIDLGIGRSPGYPIVNQALNETKGRKIPYNQQIKDVYKYLTDDVDDNHRFKDLIATPVVETMPDMWLLGTGSGSARTAAENGMAYAFAHFAPYFRSDGLEIIHRYRNDFIPSSFLQEPKVMIAVFAIIAETTEEAEEIAQSFDLWLLMVESDYQPPFFPSIKTAKQRGSSIVEREKVQKNRSRVVIGSPEQVKNDLKKLADYYQADEITIIPQFYDANNRVKGLKLLADILELRTNKLSL